jgi:hypothetical protein
LATKHHFVRRISPLNPELVVSHCVACGSFVAAAPSQNRLRIAEKHHNCAEIEAAIKPAAPKAAGKKPGIQNPVLKKKDAKGPALRPRGR